MGLQIADIFFTLLHLIIIGFNLTGWIWPGLRRLHFYSILLTAGSWLILGIWYGLGYCPITDWQWQVKTKLGEENLPSSFIKYLADKLSGTSISASLIDWITALSFISVTFLTVYLNFFKRRSSDGIGRNSAIKK